MYQNQSQGKMSSRNEREKDRPVPYKIQLRKFAKQVNPSKQTNNQATTREQQSTQKLPTPGPNHQQTQRTQMASDIHSLYTDLKNPLSYSGNADELLNKVKSYK